MTPKERGRVPRAIAMNPLGNGSLPCGNGAFRVRIRMC